MIYTDFKGKKLSLLGFGTMRLPTLKNGEIDEAQFAAMTKLAIEKGVNYFDTAWPYHNGMSEIVTGKILSKYPRDSYYLANKYPGHQISEKYDPADIFEKQLKKCGVDYFDFYMLHNVYENSMDVYLDERWGIIDYFKEQKRLGRIKHLGFSTHARTDSLKKFLDIAGDDMEFCQIQLNWLDWTLQDAAGKVALLNERNIPIWVMEPVRGGKLCKLSDENEKTLKALRPDESIAAWGFRFLQNIPGVKVILSGMTNAAQMEDNLSTFESERPLSDMENATLFRIAESMKSSIPCTACRYCTAGCPMQLDIPTLISTYNEIKIDPRTNPTMWIEGLPEHKKPSACISCGKCVKICPQMINIPEVMDDMAAILDKIPRWSDICREREEAAKKLQG